MKRKCRPTASSRANKKRINKCQIYFISHPSKKEIAERTSLVALLRSQGEILKPSGSEWEWQQQGQKVTIRGNLWYHQYEQVGGDAVAFVRKFLGLGYIDAVEYLLRFNGELIPEHQHKESKPFTLPLANENMNRVFAYLVIQRGTSRDVVYAFVHHRMIYESAKHHNAVFIGFDLDGNPRHAHKRSTAKEGTYKCNVAGSQPEYSFHWIGKSDRLYLFEAPIDLLSFVTLHPEGWQQHSYAAACSVSDRVLFQMMKDNPNIQTVCICFDSDEPGQAAAQRISDKLFVRGIKSEILVPARKDWNEDLLNRRR